MDLMIDIETLSAKPNAMILTIAAVAFDPYGNINVSPEHSYYTRVDLDSQKDRHEDDNTLVWWSRQPKEAREEAFNKEDRVPLKEALSELSKLMRKCNNVWAQGIAFDMNILENAYEEVGSSHPWQFWNVLDCRTLLKLNPVRKLGNSHNALEDCHNQIEMLQDTIKRLGITKIG